MLRQGLTNLATVIRKLLMICKMMSGKPWGKLSPTLLPRLVHLAHHAHDVSSAFVAGHAVVRPFLEPVVVDQANARPLEEQEKRERAMSHSSTARPV